VPKRRKALSQTQPADSALAALLRVIISDPTDADAACGWYVALTKRCPLWTMQSGAYDSTGAFDLGRPDALYQDLHIELMTRPSRDTVVLHRFLRSKPPAEVWRTGPAGWSFASPSATIIRSRTLRRFAPRYLVQTYRFALISTAPGAQRLASLWEKLREEQRWNDYPERIPLDVLSPPSDYQSRSHYFASELRERVIARQVLPRGRERDEAHKRVMRYLKQTRVLPNHGAKPSVPQAEDFVKRLGNEASSWLAVVETVLNAPVSRNAGASLAAWGCSDARESAWRLALPFLSQRELRYVRKNRDTREFRMLHLIHARLRGILGLTTVADHLFGAAFVRSQKSGLRTNPLTP